MKHLHPARFAPARALVETLAPRAPFVETRNVPESRRISLTKLLLVFVSHRVVVRLV